MKKSQQLLLAASAVFVFNVGYSSSVQAVSEKIGVVGANSATLSVLGVDGSKRVLKQGDAIYVNDTVSTDTSGRAQIIFADRSTVMIKENSQLKIDTFIYNPEEKSGKLSMTAAKGVLRFIGGALSKKQPVEIHTPVATIGIRGGVADTHIDGATGKTDSTFLYGQSLSVDSGDQHTTITTPSTALAVSELGAPIQAVPQAQVEQQLGAFNNTEGGATVGAQEVPSREQVQAKISEISASVSPDEGGGDASAPASESSSESSNASDSNGGGDDGGNGNGGSGGDAGGSASVTGERSPDSAAPASATPVVANVGMTSMVDASAMQAATDVAASAVVDQVKNETVIEVVDSASGTGAGGTSSGGTGVTDGSGTTTPVVPVVPETPNTEEVLSDTKQVKIIKTATSTLMGQYVALSQRVSGLSHSTGEANVTDYEISNVKTGEVAGHATQLSMPAITLVDGDVAGLTLLSTNSVSAVGVEYQTWLYNSPSNAMKYYHLASVDGVQQVNVVAGTAITQTALGALTSGYSTYQRLPDLDKWFTATQIAEAFAIGVEGTGVIVDWSKDKFLFAKIPWRLDENASDTERSVAMGTIRTGYENALVGVSIGITDGVIELDDLAASSSQIFSDGAEGVEGMLVNVSHDNGVGMNSITPIVKVQSDETPSFVNQTVEANNVRTRTDADSAQLHGFSAGLLRGDPHKIVMNTDVNAVSLQRKATDATIGLSVNYQYEVNGETLSSTSSNRSFGNKSFGGQSTMMTNNTYVASNRYESSYAASGNLVAGANQCTQCQYTQWGVWGGNAPVDNAIAKADIVPFVVGEVTQNLANLVSTDAVSGTANYTGVANMNIAYSGVQNQYSGPMNAIVNMGQRQLTGLNMYFTDVGGAGKTLTLGLAAPAGIQGEGNATFYAPLNVGYSGFGSQSGSASTFGALFGSEAEEIAGNVTFIVKETSNTTGISQQRDIISAAIAVDPAVTETGNVVKGAGIYLGAQ